MPFDLSIPYASSQKGGPSAPLLSDERALLIQPYGGKWYHAAKQGRMFTGNSAAAGAALPIFSNTAQVFGLWNPSGSGVNGIITGLRGAYVSGTAAAGGYCLGFSRNAGAGLATGGISAFTEGTPERALLGSAIGGNRIRFCPLTATVIAPVIARQLGINQTVPPATDATNLFVAFKEDFDGDLVLTPNTALWVCGNIATVCVIACSISWVEENV